ncbi:hypothetical protein D3C72_2478480 [compost metagenome]
MLAYEALQGLEVAFALGQGRHGVGQAGGTLQGQGGSQLGVLQFPVFCDIRHCFPWLARQYARRSTAL